MNKQDYKEYEQAVSDFFAGEGITNLSTINTIDGDALEPDFSNRSCDCCGSTLGGDRYQCNGWNPTLRTIEDYPSVCQDCVYYAEYGQLDDMTMLEIEA